ncbi:MAG: hypothetical protein COU90_02870 [Candidatus Ryanbacteria bacterium CG10_big_fil_rev_8_21_14_0_10_43_42]|uniref:Uncharacterized protein n=1 Tax=Candidatus Ryanbacteria bacterium CG10_big_fil_rev_8_21_14_0_10_43_42 TaxID=1974864 RepID=A0A2M8KWS8_9BACT|nr:MAG: hypothetical protein COU90_02870 [Candidatus Ryanbacteria bacterium CG10_big_fil_rev_8_21_14_0_10_43_42]
MITLPDTAYVREIKRLQNRRGVRMVLIGFVFVLAVIYMVFQTRDWVLRPDLYLDSPRDGETFSETQITVSGRVTPGVQLTINGLEAYSDETGLYATDLLLPAGVHTIEVVARNRFGRTRSIMRQIVITAPVL